MKNLTKLFLILNGIGVIVTYILSKYNDPQWIVVSFNLFLFLLVWIIVLVLKPQ